MWINLSSKTMNTVNRKVKMPFIEKYESNKECYFCKEFLEQGLNNKILPCDCYKSISSALNKTLFLEYIVQNLDNKVKEELKNILGCE